MKKVGIWKSESYLYTKIALPAGAIDTVILAGSAVKAVAVKSVFKVAVEFIKSNEQNFIKFLKNTLFLYISNNMTFVKVTVSNALFRNFKIYKWYIAF